MYRKQWVTVAYAWEKNLGSNAFCIPSEVLSFYLE